MEPIEPKSLGHVLFCELYEFHPTDWTELDEEARIAFERAAAKVVSHKEFLDAKQ